MIKITKTMDFLKLKLQDVHKQNSNYWTLIKVNRRILLNLLRIWF